jgi:DNA-binding NtrC family response regulator
MVPSTIIVAGGDTANVRLWSSWLEEAGFSVRACETPEDAETSIREQTATIFIGMSFRDCALWFGFVRRLRGWRNRLRIVILAVDSSEELAIEALRAGADDYIRQPILGQTLVAAVERNSATPAPGGAKPVHKLLGESLAMQQLRDKLERLAASNCNVLITGETGTGKELAAEAIYHHSARRHKRFVCLNCAAIPDALVESELFGHEKGAFTGADSARDGKLKAADGGVIFLDEVGDLSLYAQAKILRAVETKEIYRLGGQRPISVDVRIVAATHRNLEELTAQGRFRQDLFFRLNVGRVRMIRLRDRLEDLALLVHHFLGAVNKQLGTQVDRFSDAAWERMIGYSWPGNVRELKNVVESALVNSASPVISVEDLPDPLQEKIEAHSIYDECDEMLRALLATKWNKTKAAERLQWSRMTLYRKMAKYAVSASKDGRAISSVRSLAG